jgi:hydroxymethylpyrimidine pyrophosphatase-like HAD family hydrolase
LEVNAKDVDKGTAIKAVLLKMKISSDLAIAMGDSPNDVPGFKNVNLPIAINSDYDEVINNAKGSIPYFKNAVADAFNKYVFTEEDGK